MLLIASQLSSSGPPASEPQPRQAAKRPGTGPRLAARRSKEERDALSLAEDERRKARNLTDSSAAGAASGITVGRGRGQGLGDGQRGRGRGRGALGGVSLGASGPFSAGTVSPDLRKRKRGGGIAGSQHRWTYDERSHGSKENVNNDGSGQRTSEASASKGPESVSKPKSALRSKSKAQPTRVKKEGGSKDDGDRDISMLGLPHLKEEDNDGGYISSSDDTENGGLRRDINLIETIDLISDDEDESNSAGPRIKNERKLALHPVRLPRRDHLVDGIASKREPSPTDNGLAEQMKGHMTGDIAEEESSHRRRNTKGKDVEFIRNERRWQGVYTDEEDAAENVKQEPSDDVMEIDPIPPQPTISTAVKDPSSSPERKKKEAKTKFIGARSDFHAAQGDGEMEKQQRDIRTLMEELGQRPLLDEGASSDIRDGRVYVFQLPPVVPDLVRSDLRVKHEQQAADEENSQGNDAESSRTGNRPIKIDDAETSDTQPQKSHQPALSAGIAGKLRVHESGRTTLNWGGTSMELSMGGDLTYLQEVLVIKGASEGDTTEKEAFGLGMIRGKFIVTPDWEEIIP